MENLSTTVRSPFLTLNDDCLMNIFQYLKLGDFVNLHNTCHRLRAVGASVCAQKYKQIVIETLRNYYIDERKSKRKLVNILSVIGRYILAVEVVYPTPAILDIIKDKCKNVNDVKLSGNETRFQLQVFEKLKNLAVGTHDTSSIISANDLKNCLLKNLDLERLECSGWFEDGFIELLPILKKLKSLHLPSSHGSFINLNTDSQHLLRLDGLTKLSFRCEENCNQLLNELAKRLNLVELNLCTLFDVVTFEIVKSFRNLEALSMRNLARYFNESWLSNSTVLPPKLKYITVDTMKISCSSFLLIAKQLKFLREFKIFYGDIFWDQHHSRIGLKDPMVTNRISDELSGELGQRKLKIVFFEEKFVQRPYLHNSDGLKIMHRLLPEYQAVPERIHVKCSSDASSYLRE